MKRLLIVSSVVAFLTVSSFAAQQYLYANNASFGAPYVYQIDPATGNVLNTYTNLQGTNGRGVIDVNNILYYTTAGDGNVYKYDLGTQTQLGVAFNVAGASALASITYDGTNFWIGDYSGSNQAFLYSPTGTLLNTITLGNCTGYCDGLTYFLQGSTGYLLSNRVDGCCGGTPVYYDVYDLSGNLVTPGLLSAPTTSTGVGWDGSSFWTTNPYGGDMTQWSMTGVNMGTTSLSGYSSSYPPLVEGISFNFAQTVGTPEPGTMVLFGSGVIGLAGLLRRKFNL